MNRSSLVLALGAVLGTACSDTTNPAAAPLNLNRPVDVAFACYGRMRVTHGVVPATGAEDVISTAQPTTSCEIRSQPTAGLEFRPPGQEDIVTNGAVTQAVGTTDWYGFILESALGTVAIAHWASIAPNKFMGSVGAEVQVLDADPLTPGKNAISVGEEPIAIATDRSGCYAVTANAGSCDLSVLDINSALAGLKVNSTLGPVNPGQVGSVRVDRVPVMYKNGAKVLARPAAMVGEPSTDPIGNECKLVASSDPAMKSGMALSPSGVTYIAYPSCHLVAAVDMSAGTGGTIVAGIQFDPIGGTRGDAKLLTADEFQAVSCPVECGPATTQPTDGTRPVTLAYRFDTRVNTRRLAIGADNSSRVTLVELGTDGLPTAVKQVALQDATEKPGMPGSGKLGVTAIALSQQISMGGNAADVSENTDPERQGQFIYAVASDNTVRVVDVFANMRHPAPIECDTQVDTRFLRLTTDDTARFSSDNTQALQCFAVGDPLHTPPRRAGARGPGIELPGNGVPLSVAFVKVPPLLDLTKNPPELDLRPPSPLALLGTFAIITATSGQVFVVNVDDDANTDTDFFDPNQPQLTAPALLMAHQLRDTVGSRGQGAVVSATRSSCLTLGAEGSGGPHTTTAPLVFTTGGPIAASKILELPTIRQVHCETEPVKNPDGKDDPGDAPHPGVPVSEGMLAADSATRDEVFPDLRGLASDENWTLTWEGALSLDNAVTALDGPAIREAPMIVDSDNSGSIRDNTHPFCSMGAEKFDILQMRGCDPSNQGLDCPSGYSCFVHPDRSVSIGNSTIGTCMRADEAPRLANACRDYLISLRRYTINRVDSGELVLRPRQHVLRTTPLGGCASDRQCNQLADYAGRNATDGPEPAGDPDPTNDKWRCLADDTRAPINPDPALNARCVQRCAFHSKDTDNMDRDAGCDPGTICVGATATDLGFCMEGVMPPQACVNAPQRFEVRASEAFTVVGSRSGYVHPLIVNPDKSDPAKANSCVPDPALTRSQRALQIGRIPLNPPACGDPDPLKTDPITGEILPGNPPATMTFEANPCTVTVPQFENLKTFPDPTTCVPVIPDPSVGARDATAIRFRNRGLKVTLVDPFYIGDQVCPVDRKGSLSAAFANAKIPLVFPGYQISFHQTSGYSPLSLPNVSSSFAPAFPVKVVEGPTGSIWVIDDGDSPGSQFTAPTRGQVYRIESINLGLVNLLQ